MRFSLQPVHPRLARLAAAATGSEQWLLETARSRIGRDVLAATALDIDAGPLGRARRGEQLLIAVTDDDIYLLDYRSRTIGPTIGGVLQHLPRSGVLVQWRRRPMHLKLELSWPEQHTFITGAARPGAHTDRVLGELIGSELEDL